MASKTVEYTEILHKEITEKDRAVWKDTKRKVLRKIYPILVLAVITTILEIAALISCAFLLENFINNVQSTGKVNYVLVIVIVVALVGRAIFVFLMNYLTNVICCKGQKYLCTELYKKTLYNNELLQNVQTGDIINMIGSDAAQVGMNLGLRRLMMIASIAETCTVLGVIYYFSWVVGIAVTIFYPLYFLICGIVNKKIQKKSYTASRCWANTSHVRLKGIQGWLELAILKKQNFYTEKYNNSFDGSIKQQISLQKFISLEMVFQVTAALLLPVLCVVISTLPILAGASVSLGTMLIVYMLSGYFQEPLHSLTESVKSISEGKASCQRLSDIIYFDCSDDGEAVESIDEIKIDINKYSYNGEEELLKDCRLDVKKGDLVAVRGDSGCGKSTLFKLLIKQNPYELLDGSITYNDTPVQELSRGKLYDKLQYVSQNYFVFEDTLYNNLCMGDEFSAESINEAIDICCLRDFVNEYGLDTVLEENGKNISQGQLQRVCIARAILRKPQCLLLDEPTSALDEQTGNALMKNLTAYAKEHGTITFVISHKNEVVGRADKSVVLTK